MTLRPRHFVLLAIIICLFVFGIEQSRHDAAELIADAFAALAPFGEAAAPLKSLAQYLVDRTH